MSPNNRFGKSGAGGVAVDIGGENRFVRFKNRRCAALWHDANKVVQQAGVIHIKRGKSVADDKVVFGQMAAQGGNSLDRKSVV